MFYEHGLIVARFQPLHNGHIRILDKMLRESKNVTILLGSIQEQNTLRNPFSFQQRKQMILNHYQDKPEFTRMKIFGIQDLGNDKDWGRYVLDFVEMQLPETPPVDALYCGSHYDGHWFRGLKSGGKELHIAIYDRTNQTYPYVTGTMVRDMCTLQDIRWKLYTPECNWKALQEFQEMMYWERKQ